ncbi:MAG TPA: prepilin-type N-terminal cleavage/methylation domain-containing protein [Longimicrobiales bacterium]
MKKIRENARAGFTLVELTVVVVISSLALLAVYETLITQERTYRYQSAAIDAQGSTRTALSLLAGELREVSASAGGTLRMSGSDLLTTTRDSVRFRAFRKVGIVCSFSRLTGLVDLWVPGTAFERTDRLLVFSEGDSITDEDDHWDITSPLAVGSPIDASCATEWPTYQVQGLQLAITATDSIERGALIRSFETLSYGAYRHDGEWVLGRWDAAGVVPLVGPTLSPSEGGIRFQYFDVNGTELTPTTAADRARVSRIQVTIRSLSRGGIEGDYVDSLTTNVYLRGN